MSIDKLDLFMKDFDDLLKKYKIHDIVLSNHDNDEMGFQQLHKIIHDENGRFLVLAFSGSGRKLCPCCNGKENKCAQTVK